MKMRSKENDKYLQSSVEIFVDVITIESRCSSRQAKKRNSTMM